jgi:hypothetical protein
MKSFSEIDTTSKRAARAAGYSWGISEEVGKNIKLLEFFGLPGIKNLIYFLKKKKLEKFENLNLITADNKTTKTKFCPLISGTSFLDQAKSLENLKEIKFNNIAFPILFLPFVSRASELIGKRLFLKIDKNEYLLNFNKKIYSNFLTNEVIEFADNVLIKFLNNSDSFTENEWKELYKLSEDTFVEERESLKKDSAGAGLTDND